MASTIPVRSILKQRSDVSNTQAPDEPTAKAERDRRNLNIALFHANKIQSQKDVQAVILRDIETLLDYPHDREPSPSEAVNFLKRVTPFQPSDFDSLVEERRTAGRCGYVLCANSPRSKGLGPSAVWKLKGRGAGDYCSNVCLQKALYVKAQLSEVPAWEREPGQQPRILLPQDDRVHITTMRQSNGHTPPRVPNLTNDERLAAERGEKPGTFRPNQVMLDEIAEKPTVPGNHLAKGPNALSHDVIEGYVPSRKGDDKDESSDIQTQPSVPLGRSQAHTAHRADDDEAEAWDALYDNLVTQ